jgi:lysophospholipase L1-like esterase
VTAGPAPQRVWERFAAVGDSFTEGMCDPDPDRHDAYVGWADRLAARLAAHARAHGRPFGYANLAVRGRLLADIVGPQLDEALTMEPDLVSIVGGGNDILRPRADLDALAGRLESAVARVRQAGADVLLATPVDPREAPLVRHTRGRAAVHAANIFAIARRHDAYVIDQWSMASLRDWRMWAEDRIHMTSEGHRRVALNALWALGFPDDEDWRAPLPAAPQLSRRETARANAAWARTYVAPWVQRRLRGRSSGDAVAAKRPDLVPVDENWP